MTKPVLVTVLIGCIAGGIFVGGWLGHLVSARIIAFIERQASLDAWGATLNLRRKRRFLFVKESNDAYRDRILEALRVPSQTHSYGTDHDF